MIGLGPASEEEVFDQKAETRGMQRALKRGQEDGVYREMLKSISTGHSIGQKLRGAMFMAGLMTDRNHSELPDLHPPLPTVS